MKQNQIIYPKPFQAWYMVVLLSIGYIISMIDRSILALLIEPIKKDMALSDTQIGLLLGPAFAIFYVTMGLPIGWLADHTRRTVLVSMGVALWSFATAASGFARGFATLFIARLGVGVGEAALSPCALSLISDSFPTKTRARALAFYLTAPSVGLGLAYLTGAAVINWASTAPAIEIPGIGEASVWRLALIIVGLPGLFLALLLILVKEPTRKEQSGNVSASGGNASLVDTFRYINSRRSAFLTILSVMSVISIIAYNQQWLAPLFQRTWGWSPSTFGLYHGLSYLIIGPVFVNATGWLIGRMQNNGRSDAAGFISITAVILLLIIGSIYPLLPNAVLAFIVLQLTAICIVSGSAATVVAILHITPGEIRGQVSAIYYTTISITGLLLGPSTVAFLTDYVFKEEAMLRYSMSITPWLFGLPLLLYLLFAGRRYREECLRLENANTHTRV